MPLRGIFLGSGGAGLGLSSAAFAPLTSSSSASVSFIGWLQLRISQLFFMDAMTTILTTTLLQLLSYMGYINNMRYCLFPTAYCLSPIASCLPIAYSLFPIHIYIFPISHTYIYIFVYILVYTYTYIHICILILLQNTKYCIYILSFLRFYPREACLQNCSRTREEESAEEEEGQGGSLSGELDDPPCSAIGLHMSIGTGDVTCSGSVFVLGGVVCSVAVRG